MRRLTLAAYALLTLAVPSAISEPLKIDGVAFELALPDGYCALTETSEHANERRHIELQKRIQTQNTVLRFAVACAELDGVRRGKPLQRWAIWLMTGPPSNPVRIPTDAPRADVIKELLAAYPMIDTKKMQSDLDSTTAAENLSVQLKQMGVIDHDASGIYMGQVADVANTADEKGKSRPRQLAVVMGQTNVVGRFISINVYADFENRETFDRLLGLAKPTMAQTIQKTEALPVDKSVPDGMKPVGEQTPAASTP
jgi:hypothetical protein